jgi:hypothetical protein
LFDVCVSWTSVDQGRATGFKSTGNASGGMAPLIRFRFLVPISLIRRYGHGHAVIVFHAIRQLELPACTTARLWSGVLQLLICQCQTKLSQAAAHAVRFAAGVSLRRSVSSIHDRDGA